MRRISTAATLASAATLLLLMLGLMATSASAMDSYQYAGTFSAGEDPIKPFGECTVHDLDVDVNENVYVLCGGNDSNFAGGTVLKKFDKNGNPVPFTGTASYITGNTIIENPDPNGSNNSTFGKTFTTGDALAVDKSSGPDAGFIYVAASSRVTVLNPAGEFAGGFGGKSVATDADGNVYTNCCPEWLINKRSPSWVLTNQIWSDVKGGNGIQPGGTDLAIDSNGAIWGIGKGRKGVDAESISRWEANQMGPPEEESTFAIGGNHPIGKLSPLVPSPLLEFGSTAQLHATSIAVDPRDDSLLAQRSTPAGIVEFSSGSAEEHSHQLGAAIGDATSVGSENENSGLGIGPTGTIYVAKGNGFSKLTPGPVLPVVRDHVPQADEVEHTGATVGARIELAGGSPITSCEVKYGLTEAYGSTAPCLPNPAEAPPGSNFATDTEVTAHLTGLLTGSTYHFAFVASNASGTSYGIDRTVTPTAVLNVQTNPATDVTDSSATLNGSFDPDGMSTTYHFEYGLAGDLTDSTAPVAPVTGSGIQQVSLPVTNLKADAEYRFRLVATNSLGTTLGPVQSFTVAGPPIVSGVGATEVSADAANLNARVNPGGYPTTYRFEYGTGISYGTTVPAGGEGSAGEGTTGTVITNHIEGLAGTTYHFRVIATNKWGTTTSNDTTFNFFPQACPNEHVRQQMKSSYLPDCRAYELVSPENAGGAQIYPGNEIYTVGNSSIPNVRNVIGAQHNIANTGLANSPSRFEFFAGLGSIPGLDAPNAELDSYISTRTDHGWKTTYSGIKGSETGGTGAKFCSIGLDICLDHFLNAFEHEHERFNTGYLFNVSGEKVGIAPSNVNLVEGGEHFIGDWNTSPNFDHFVFSSRNVAFTPDGLTQAPGSAYDNDLRTKAVTLISRLPNGDPIPQDSSRENEFITFPPTDISRDGTHILMETQATNGPNHLYMRVNDATSYDISEGAGVKFIGMSSDGTKVLFSTAKQLTREDEDESADIYMWRENGGSPSVELLSQGNGEGNSDECNATWTSKCSVVTVETERGDRSGFSSPEYASVALPGTDSKLASESGGVYFFSPETLAGSAPRNGKNLYLANDGEIQYVATLAGTQGLNRLQISPDGIHAGFVTASRLTSYENAGFKEMYTYNARTEELVCASCLPSGAAPTADVEASQNGPFMSDDGRVFFTTPDKLVPQDVDTAGVPDVYEYVEGRPQLISSGTSSDGKVPGGATVFTGEVLGLESVSSDGRDVFFSTTDTLVPQDANGHFAKIYDARTDGGFEVPAEPAPCVAADECHGAGAATPAPLQIGTGSSTTGGNLKPVAKHRAKKCRSAKRRNSRKGKRESKKTCGQKGGKRR